MLISLNDKAGLSEFVKVKLAKDPNNFTALAMSGQANMNEHKWDEAIADLSKQLQNSLRMSRYWHQ